MMRIKILLLQSEIQDANCRHPIVALSGLAVKKKKPFGQDIGGHMVPTVK